MSHKPRERRFWFRGNAAAFGGRITSPVCESLDSQGASVLPPTGGFASAAVDSFNYKNIVAFERASSTVAGRITEHDGRRTYDTQVTVTVEGLNVLDMVTADRVVARMTSSHSEEGADPQMLPVGSYFENLRVGGAELKLTQHPKLARHGAYADLAEACAGRFVDAQGNPVTLGDRPDLETKRWTPGEPSPIFQDRLLLAPLFDAANEHTYPVGAETIGTAGIHVPGFGTIYLGEYLISRYSRRLTMLRIELGCPVEGTIEAASGDINGNLHP